LCEPNYVPAFSNIDSFTEVVAGERQNPVDVIFIVLRTSAISFYWRLL